MSRKQEIYTELLFWSLPTIRNIQSRSAWIKARDKSCYQEAEFVHTLHSSILEPEFVDNDIYFLNHQARTYFKNGNCSIAYNAQIELLNELFSLVPKELKNELVWQGPSS